MSFLPLAFFATALLYGSVGFGGGSTYNTLLVLANADYRAIPFISLICNIIVVSGGVWHFRRERHLRITPMIPWIICSVVASFIGGLIALPEVFFVGLLGAALLLSGVKLLWPEKAYAEVYPEGAISQHKFIPPVMGTSLGLLAGLTGIGGGIFLAPVLHFLRWGDAKQIAGSCSLFILVNSLAGLAGHAVKLTESGALSSFNAYWTVLPAVLIGGQLGTWLGASHINAKVVKKITAIVVLYVAVRLLIKFAGMIYS